MTRNLKVQVDDIHAINLVSIQRIGSPLIMRTLRLRCM